MVTFSDSIAEALRYGLSISFRRDHEKFDVYHVEVWRHAKPDLSDKPVHVKRSFPECEFMANAGNVVIKTIGQVIAEIQAPR